MPVPSQKLEESGRKARTAEEINEIVAQEFSNWEFASVEDAREFLAKAQTRLNDAPVDDFLGLSPNIMGQVLDVPLSLDNVLFKYRAQDNESFEEVSLVQEAVFLMETIAEAQKGELKATQKGFFPRKIVHEIHDRFYSENKRELFKPHSQSASTSMMFLGVLMTSCGFIKKRNNKFSLTKAGQKILEEKDWDQLFQRFLEEFGSRLVWSFADFYPPFPMIQKATTFNLFMLHKLAQDWLLVSKLGGAFLKAFPFLEEEVQLGYEKPRDEVISAFQSRFLRRFCFPMGLVERDSDSIFTEKIRYRSTRFFKNSFHFKL